MFLAVAAAEAVFAAAVAAAAAAAAEAPAESVSPCLIRIINVEKNVIWGKI